MIHHMKLQPGPFAMIKSGQKTIELRVLDPKRRKIAVGDVIEFTNLGNRWEKLRVRVMALHPFASFADLYAALPLLQCGYTEADVSSASPEDMDRYYARQEQAKWGVVGIALALIKDWRDGNLTKTSRYISLLLRHKPEAAGLTLDPNGWASVPELIRCVSRTHPLDMAMLEEIVRSDEKHRYAFSEDKTRIRANQGHSVAVDVQLQEAVPPEQLWHGTATKYVADIMRQGLLPRTRLYVHLSSNYDTAVKVGSRHGSAVVLQVHAGQMHREGYRFFLSENGVWLTDKVPAEYIFCPAESLLK